MHALEKIHNACQHERTTCAVTCKC